MSDKVVKTNEASTGKIIKNALVLFVFTMVAGILLGMTYDTTKATIAEQERVATENAYKAVFSDAESFNLIYSMSDPAKDAAMDTAFQSIKAADSNYSKVNLYSVNEALDANGAVLGYVVSMTSSGYSSNIRFSIGFRQGENGTHMNAVSIVSIAESPGLGMNAEPVLIPQYNQVNEAGECLGRDDLPFTVTKDNDGTFDNGKINAISAATISSKAITNGINAGYDFYEQVLKGAN